MHITSSDARLCEFIMVLTFRDIVIASVTKSQFVILKGRKKGRKKKERKNMRSTLRLFC